MPKTFSLIWRHLLAVVVLLPVLSCDNEGGSSQETSSEPQTHIVIVNADGSFTPEKLVINDGDTVVWQFQHRTDTIVPVNLIESEESGCWTYRPYDSDDPNEFTGPLPRACSGIFTLLPDGAGAVIEIVDGEEVITPGEPYAMMDWTWENPNLTGVFIRLRWNEVHTAPGVFDFTILDREIEKAVKNGKVYSLSFKAGKKGTPTWIFDPNIAGENVVKKLTFQDTGSNGTGLGSIMDLGSPADMNYRKHYFDLWKEVASRILARNAWYRALAYVKPSGMNLFSHENRLPNGCNPDSEYCNTKIWAEEGNYTPSALYEFYSEQTALLAELFPDKDMSYMLIQAGFPLVNENSEWTAPFTVPLPGGLEQTETLLERGRIEHQLRFVVQHNGLGPMPQDRAIPKDPCPNEDVHPAQEPFASAGSG